MSAAVVDLPQTSALLGYARATVQLAEALERYYDAWHACGRLVDAWTIVCTYRDEASAHAYADAWRSPHATVVRSRWQEVLGCALTCELAALRIGVRVLALDVPRREADYGMPPELLAPKLPMLSTSRHLPAEKVTK